MNERAVLLQTCTAAATMAGGLMRSSALSASRLSFWRGEAFSTCQSRQGGLHTKICCLLWLSDGGSESPCLLAGGSQDAAGLREHSQASLQRGGHRKLAIPQPPEGPKAAAADCKARDGARHGSCSGLDGELPVNRCADLCYNGACRNILSSAPSVLCVGPVSGSRLCEWSITWPAFPD